MTREEAHNNVKNWINETSIDKDKSYSGFYGKIELHRDIDRMFDHFEQKEAELRAEFQKKISEINMEHDSRVCKNCKIYQYQNLLFKENEMDEFIVWDNHLKKLTSTLDMPISESTNSLQLLSNKRYTYHKWIGKKDIDNKKIYADRSIVEWKETHNFSGDEETEILRGYFYFCQESLRYKLKYIGTVFGHQECILDPCDWDSHISKMKIIDTIQENKLGLYHD